MLRSVRVVTVRGKDDMQLSTKGRYAVMALADLASRSAGRPVRLAEIAARQNISLAYLEQLFSRMRRAGLVESMRGPGGGYVLARDPVEIVVADIMRAVDEPVKMTRCGGEDENGCMNDDRCITHDLWSALSNRVVSFLNGVTLFDVVDGTALRALAASEGEAMSLSNWADEQKIDVLQMVAKQ